MADRAPLPYDFMPAVPSFELRSGDVADGQMMTDNQVYNAFGITGKNISPSLSWSGFPAETKGFAITCFDPDAPTGSGFWHWVLVDIPASVTSLRPAPVMPTDQACPPGRCTYVTTTEARISAAPRRRLATRRTATSSPCTRWASRISVSTRPRRRLTSVSR